MRKIRFLFGIFILCGICLVPNMAMAKTYTDGSNKYIYQIINKKKKEVRILFNKKKKLKGAITIPATIKNKSKTKVYKVVGVRANGFKNQKKITSVKFKGTNCRRLCDNSFYGCTSLKSVVIPKSITYIGKKAFKSCTSLRLVEIQGSKVTIKSSAFSDTADGCRITTPNTAVSKAIQSAGVSAVNMTLSSYQITYHGNGADSGNMMPQTVSYTKIITLGNCNFARYGYQFIGWSTSPNGAVQYANKASVKSLTKTGAISLYACWKPIRIFINFQGNTGDTSIDEQVLGSSSLLSGTTTMSNSIYTLEEDNWEDDTEDIDDDGATETEADEYDGYVDGKLIGIYGKNIGFSDKGQLELPILVRRGYHFLGWFFDKEGTQEATTRSVIDSISDKTLYARWSIDQIKLSFDAYTAGGTCSQGFKLVTPGDEYGEFPVAEKKGCDFIGWGLTKPTMIGSDDDSNEITDKADNTDEDEDDEEEWDDSEWESDSKSSIKTYADVPPIAYNYAYIYPNSIVSSKENFVLYAYFAPKTYSINYQTDGGILSADAPLTYQYGTTQPLTKPTKQGFQFVGWYTNPEKTNKILRIVSGVYEDITLYAKWNPIVCKITYRSSLSGIYNPNVKEVFAGTALNLVNAKNAGYYFMGWYTDGNFNCKVNSIVPWKSVTLYAKWDPIVYKISYKNKKGKRNTNIKYYQTGTAYTFTKPVRKGYKFKGWYTNKKMTNKITKITKKMHKKLTLYARWVKK